MQSTIIKSAINVLIALLQIILLKISENKGSVNSDGDGKKRHPHRCSRLLLVFVEEKVPFINLYSIKEFNEGDHMDSRERRRPDHDRRGVWLP